MAEVVGIVAGVIATAAAISEWAPRSAIIEINNMTPETLELFQYETSSGDLQRPLLTVIQPFDSGLVVAVSHSLGEGAVGSLHLRGRDMWIDMDYANPEVGENDLDAEVKGARAHEFRWATSAGPGNKSARFRASVWQDYQRDWRFCPKCRGVFTPGVGSRCPAGGPHEALGWNYILLHDVPEGPNLQATWRFCGRCRGLFAEGDGGGVCPAGGAHAAAGWRYCVPHDLAPGAHLQGGWRFCGQCRILFGADAGNGVCPAGGPHVPLGWPYLLVVGAVT